MLQKPKNLTEMIMMDLAHRCAIDPETGAWLMKSNGRRKAGRLTRYWYKAPGMLNARVLYAESDDDAIRQIDGDAPNTVCTGQVAGAPASPLLSIPEPSPVKVVGSEPAATCR